MRRNVTKILKQSAVAASMAIAITVPAFAGTGRNASLQPHATSAAHIYGREQPVDDEQPPQSEFAVNDAQIGNYELMSMQEQEAVKKAITAFKNTYIKAGMSDVEKELMIISWLVDRCYYEKTGDGTDATAYGCIIKGRAKCAGYADAFLQTAKACGLDARYIYNSEHAWNLVRLDGQWYHVDVTWEDPVGQNSYGFSEIRNQYINLTDDQVRELEDHHDWYPMDIAAAGTAYGQEFIAWLLAANQR